jgi:hypothetical protein
MAIDGSGARNQPSSTLSRAMVRVTTVAMFGAAAAMFLILENLCSEQGQSNPA